jgi:hypothetical protein
MNFYEDTIVPECEFIAGVMNEQLLEPLGYRLVFDHQELAIFQEDEEQRSAALYNMVGSTIRPSIAAEVLGYQLPDEVEYADLDEKWEIDLKLKQTTMTSMAGSSEEDEEETSATDAMAEGNNPRDMGKTGMQLDLDKWERKALNLIKKDIDPACTFESNSIPLVLCGAIEGALEATTTSVNAVKGIFDDVWVGYP